ncbi:hypothetical protein [Mesorhizobium sp. ZC-5]|uniref:hypothetical protein n=1 Tax=Mesorhizobium sp. ZC-5 TaxID=2986066 RepID=UPI0021E87943|nr:hypothetical protein [Mesorhizobium sp. ZC-5]MCV3239677.1 hypothetical protein [Mesorhizobium sp. ZC-5]
MDNNIDVEIADFRNQHDEALSSRAHHEHKVRAAQLTALFERKFGDGEPAPGAGVAKSATPETPAVTPADVVGGNQPGDDLARLAEPAQKPSDYDFSKLQDRLPVGIEVQEDAQLEAYSREWLLSGQVSPAEGAALASVYAESLSWSPDQVARMGEQTERDLRRKYGPDAPALGTAVMRVVSETPGLQDFLEGSGLINHARVIDSLAKAAEKRGYFKRTVQ